MKSSGNNLFFFLATMLLILGGPALAEDCTLKTYAASWMTTGTPFTVECASGTYSGHLVSTPARRFFRRGHLVLVFDRAVQLQPKREGDEGIIQSGRGKQVANILTAGGVGIGAKDLSDGIASAAFKSWYMIPISGVALAFFENGGDVLLKPGYKLQVLAKREQLPQLAPQGP